MIPIAERMADDSAIRSFVNDHRANHIAGTPVRVDGVWISRCVACGRKLVAGTQRGPWEPK